MHFVLQAAPLLSEASALVAASIDVDVLQLECIHGIRTLPGCTLAGHSKDPVPLLRALVLPELHQHWQVVLACKALAGVLEPSSKETLLPLHSGRGC